jgi:hypothetical protein
MARSLRLFLTLVLLGVLGGATVSSTAADSRQTFSSGMTGLPTGSLVLYGITGGGVPWSIGAGSATLTSDGRVHVQVQGLVVAASGANPVDFGKAVVTCAGVFAGETATVPFSDQGNATINDVITTLPSPCLGPAVFFTSASGRWFAVTGF